MTNPKPVLLEARNVERTYHMGSDVVVHALRGVDLTVDVGDSVAIIGSSGSGKSTLLNLLGALDRPSAGQVLYDGRDVRSMSDAALADLRNRRIGFVFQSFHLLARLSARDNVELPLVYRRMAPAERRRRAQHALETVGLASRTDHRPTELSGGQQQRVAIARALVTDPALILADEPTGNLDTGTGNEIMDLLTSLHRERGTALVIITHEREVADLAETRVELRDGVVVKVATREGNGRQFAAHDPEVEGGQRGERTL